MIDTKQFTEVKPDRVDQFFGYPASAFQGVEQLTALNMQAAKTLLAEIAEGTQAVLSARTPGRADPLQAAALQTVPAKTAAYANQVKAIVESSFASQRVAAEAKVAEAQVQFVDAIAGMLKNAPGSENALALVKSAVAASNDAYEGANKAVKQVAEAIEANSRSSPRPPAAAVSPPDSRRDQPEARR